MSEHRHHSEAEKREPARSEAQLRRGVSPQILLSQVENTVPFALRPEFNPELAFIRTLRQVQETPNVELSHLEYFRLCLSAHYTTVASYVPTDVDQQIRSRLWDPSLPLDTVLEMAKIVTAAHDWPTNA